MGPPDAWIWRRVSPDQPKIKDAATVIVFRQGSEIELLMGQRGAKAVFMPEKFVFPGGAVAAEDHQVPLAGKPSQICLNRLQAQAEKPTPEALLVAAIRELWEETGLKLGFPSAWQDVPEGWEGFAQAGLRPDASHLRYVFRAVTPPVRPRRFDARFFLVSAEHLIGTLGGDGELSHLQWIGLSEVSHYALPFITQVVLAELPRLVAEDGPPQDILQFHGHGEKIVFSHHGKRAPWGPV